MRKYPQSRSVVTINKDSQKKLFKIDEILGYFAELVAHNDLISPEQMSFWEGELATYVRKKQQQVDTDLIKKYYHPARSATELISFINKHGE